ncbi:MrpH family fimbial adhesin [Klebsiella aerogenes]
MNLKWNIGVASAAIALGLVSPPGVAQENHADATTLVENGGTYTGNFGGGYYYLDRGSAGTGCPTIKQAFCKATADISATNRHTAPDSRVDNCLHSVNTDFATYKKTITSCDTSSLGSDWHGYSTAGATSFSSTPGFSAPDGQWVCAVTYAGPDIPSLSYWYSADCIPGKPALTCSATDVTIDYGSLTPDTFDGAVKTASTSVTCTGDASVTLNLSPSVVVLTNNGTSNLTSSAPPSQPLTVRGNSPTNATVTSVLHGVVEPGYFQGSATLTVNIL